MKIEVRTPARIDLAGGTLDLWPLHLFFEQASTINCAIDQFAEVSIEVGQQTKVVDAPTIHLESADRGVQHDFASFGQLVESFQGRHKAVGLNPSLWLHARVVRYFHSFWKRTASLSVRTKCASPAGAGLGGSSALNIALCVAMRELTGASLTDEHLLDLARDLETTVIDVPAGVQDYWSALFGGINAIRLDPGKLHRKTFYKQKNFIESHVTLAYSGQSRNSGINNWAVYKALIDGDTSVRSAFELIIQATHDVELALERQSFELLARGLEKEWSARQKLAPGISTPEIQNAMDGARQAGAKASKICGAGGGGCFIVASEPEKRAAVEQALLGAGVKLIPFKVWEEPCRPS